MTAAGTRGIHVLPPEVAARIAAGEVIERPVSVVRELLDNAIDAGATRVALEVEEGGVGLIRVTDNGRGIPPHEIEIAFERHATSKLWSLEELSAVRTLGFRGEALPSIAAAADVEVTTRAAGEPVGVNLVLVQGKVVRRAGRPAPTGTTIAVRNLFASLPARRKFLGTPVAEARQVTVLASHYALAYPGIAFQVSSNGRRVLTTTGNGDLRHAFAAVYGADAGSSMLDVDHDEAGVLVAGLAGPPGLTRGNRTGISVFVNGRWIQSRALTWAVVEAYHGQLPVGRFPVACLRVSVADEEVDVNVHPAKAEVRFRDERAVASTVRHAVSGAVDRAAPVVSWEPVAGGLTSTEHGLRQRLEGLPAVPAALSAPQAVQAPFTWPQPAAPANAGPASAPGTTHRDVLPLLRVVGQMANTYVVGEGPDGMYLVDQHAAHERVVFDRIIAARAGAGEAVTQPLLEPALLELDVRQAATLEEFRAHLTGLGLEPEPFGETSYLVRSVPVGIGDHDLATAIRSLLDQLAGERRVTDPFGRAAATIACHASVRAGTALSMEEMRRLLEDLERTEAPRTCPHGRPTVIHVSRVALERQFGRR